MLFFPLLLLKYVAAKIQGAIMTLNACGNNLPILLSPAGSGGFGSGNVSN